MMARSAEDIRAEDRALRAIARGEVEPHNPRAQNRAILREALAVMLDRGDQAAIARLQDALERAGD